jgi:hypothetical protein
MAKGGSEPAGSGVECQEVAGEHRRTIADAEAEARVLGIQRKLQRQTTSDVCRMGSWRAGCGESRTSGSEGGPEKPTDRKVDRALWPDSYCSTHVTRIGQDCGTRGPNRRLRDRPLGKLMIGLAVGD